MAVCMYQMLCYIHGLRPACCLMMCSFCNREYGKQKTIAQWLEHILHAEKFQAPSLAYPVKECHVTSWRRLLSKATANHRDPYWAS